MEETEIVSEVSGTESVEVTSETTLSNDTNNTEVNNPIEEEFTNDGGQDSTDNSASSEA